MEADADFDASFRSGNDLDVNSALDDLHEKRAYVYARSPERDAQFRPAIEAIVAEIAFSLRGIDAPMVWYSTYLFLSSGGSVTPYHMDRAMNFLLQIHGSKNVLLCNR